MPIRKGQILGEGYRLIHPLKVGRFTQVWFGRSMSSGEQVAIKILEIERVPRLRAERFRREMKIVSSLDHRNICKVFDAGQTDGGLYFFVMPMLIGRPLSEVLKERSLDVQRVIDIASQVISGLKAAHQARIVHRDVKPSNIFITRNIPGVTGA
jgi:serine/threonine protein kinase